MTNFGKEEVLKIRQGIQVIARNIRMTPFIMFSLSRINGTLPAAWDLRGEGTAAYSGVYIYTDT